jgi:ATP-dependent DNA helicase RecG
LSAMRETVDGFEIARRDLALRGPGELLGTRQTGEQRLRIADLLRDQDLLPLAQREADRLLAQTPALADRIISRWLGRDPDRYVQA